MSAGRAGRLAALGLAAVLVLAFGLRSLGFETVFVDDDTVVLELADASYHARRAFWTLQNFPHTLNTDPYLNYPDGAPVPWPPGFDWMVAAVSLLLGGSRHAFERVAAWTPPVLSTLAVVPIFLLGARLRSAALGLGAAALFACLGIAVHYGAVGNLDHHAAQPLLGTLLLLGQAALLDGARSRRALLAGFAGLVATRLALLLTWQGSLLYLGPCELGFTVLAALGRRSDLLAGQAASALLTAALAAPFVRDTGLGGAYSAIELSRLHLVAFGSLALVSGAVAALERVRPTRSGLAQAGRVLGASAALGLGLLSLPALRDGLGAGLAFLALGDEYGAINLENQPLFSGGPASGARALAALGGFAYLLPLAPLVLGVAAWRRRAAGPLWLLAGWLALIAPLALTQRRYANDFAPVGCLAFAWLLASSGDLLRRSSRSPSWLAPALPTALGLLLLAPLLPQYVRSAHAGAAALLASGAGADRALETPKGSLLRFARAVREATPATSGLYEPDARPEYSVLAFVGIGHALHWVAERATPADNFGPYIGHANYRAVSDWFGLTDEDEAVAIARRLGARYVVSHTPQFVRDTMQHRLHLLDGSERAPTPALGHFRLVTEGPAGGLPVSALFGANPYGHLVPYKLFELVEGAELRVAVEPGARVTARIELQTPVGRRFHWVTVAHGGEDGEASLRLPYASAGTTPTRALGPYHVFVAGEPAELDVSERDVLEGRVVHLP